MLSELSGRRVQNTRHVTRIASPPHPMRLIPCISAAAARPWRVQVKDVNARGGCLSRVQHAVRLIARPGYLYHALAEVAELTPAPRTPAAT